MLKADIAVQVTTVIDAGATMRSLRRLGDVFDTLDEVVDRRHLLATCLSRVVVRHDALEFHVPAVRLLVEPAVSLNARANVSSFIHAAPARGLKTAPKIDKIGPISRSRRAT